MIGRARAIFAPPLVAAAIVLFALFAEAWSRRTPAPLTADAPADRFAAGRAMAVVERLLGEGAPHPVGSAANARVRETIEAELIALGLAPVRRETYVCRGGRVCAPVVNVTARIEGDADAAAVMLASHYDSVHAGPGAGDDVHAVAVMLEVARALVRDGPRRHPVVLLFDEGEEVGLLGATAFVRDLADPAEIGAVVNLEARGTTGRTSMFETAPGNLALVELYADAVTDPEATSLAVEVYRRMPNDTDFTVLRQAGLVGFNLAFIGGVSRYHTPLDDLEHLDPGSVQHQGDTALALVRALADGVPGGDGSDAAFTDVLGMVLLHWPSAWSVPLLVAALVGLAVATAFARRRGRVRLRGLAVGLGAVLAMLVVPTLVGIAIVRVVALVHGTPVAALAQPLPLRVAAWAGTAVAATAVAMLVSRRVRAPELALASACLWAAVGVGASVPAPGVAPPFVLPLVPGAAAIALGVVRPQLERPAFALALAAFAVPWAALAYGLEDAFGWSLAAAAVLPIAAIATSAAWAFVGDGDRRARRAVLVACGALALGGIVGATLVDVYDRDSPRRLTLVHWDDRERGETVVAVAVDGGPMPETLAQAAAFAEPPRAVLPWTSAAMWVAPTAPTGVAPPRLEIARTEPIAGGRRVWARLSSPRRADRAILRADARAPIRALSIGSEPVDLAADGPLVVHLFGLAESGLDVRFDLATGAPLDLLVVDCSAGVPDPAIVAARDRVGVPAQWGDATCVGVRAAL